MLVSGPEITSGKYAFHPDVLGSSFVAHLVALCLCMSWWLFSGDSHLGKKSCNYCAISEWIQIGYQFPIILIIHFGK